MSEPVQVYTAYQYVNALAPTQSYSQFGNFYGVTSCQIGTKLELDFSTTWREVLLLTSVQVEQKFR